MVNNLPCVSVNESYHDQLTGLTWLLWEAEPSRGQRGPESLHQLFFFVLNEEGPSERLPMRPLTLDLRTDPTDGAPTYEFRNIQTFLTNYWVNQIMRFV